VDPFSVTRLSSHDLLSQSDLIAAVRAGSPEALGEMFVRYCEERD
jgi:hypothetical protein